MENQSLLRTDRELAEMYERNVNMIYKLCYIYLKNTADAEDAVQSVFLKLLSTNTMFHDLNHEKAWFITAARNHCKDVLKSWWRKCRVGLDALPESTLRDGSTQMGEVLESLLKLPEKYKTVLFLYYFEDYSVKEISELLNRKESTIQSQLQRGREQLKIDLGGNSLV